MVESGMYAIRPEIEFSGFSSFHQTEEELLDFLENYQDEQMQPILSGFPYDHDPGLPVCPFYSLPVFPTTLAKLNDFKEEIPAKFLKYELPPRNSSETDEEWSFLDFLEQIPPAKVTWQVDNTNKVLHFGPFFGKIFMGIADILYSYHKSNLFSGDVIGRMRIHYGLRITHPYTPANTSHNDLDGRKVDIIHFRWLVAKVVRKYLGEDYESHLSKYFKVCFSELFLHSDGLERYYMFQYYHPVFYNDEDKYKLVHVLRDLQKRDVPYFSQHFGLNNPEYGYHCWWLSLAEENDESMLGGVYLYKDNNIKVYDNNPNSLPIFLRNCHEHYTGGTETKNKRTMNRYRQIEKNRVKIQIKNEKVQQRMRYRGQRDERTETKNKRTMDRYRQIEKENRVKIQIKNEKVQKRMRYRGQRDERYTGGTETKIKRIMDRNRQIEKENRKKIQIKNEKVQQRMRYRGQRDEHYTGCTKTKIKRIVDRNRKIERENREKIQIKNEKVQQRMRYRGQRDEHYTGGTETKNKRIIMDCNRQIEKENREKIQIKNEKVQQRMCSRGQRDKLQLTPRKREIQLDQLPFHCDLEFKITERFPGIYACMIDSCIRGFNDNGERRFGCTLAQLLFEKSPFGCQQQQVGYRSHYFADGDCFLKRGQEEKM